MVGLAIVLTFLPALHRQPDPAEAVLKRVVFGCQIEIAGPTAERDRDVTARLRGVEERCQAFLARTPPPRTDTDMGLAANARWMYAQRLFAVAAGDAATEAAEYATALRPCYEWEGFHDCPEREAVFADRYLAAHPSSAFAAYLPLLAAHRWLCAAEGYEREMRSDVPASKQGVGLTRARLSFVQRLEAAGRSRAPLIRCAAATLIERGACF
jgi:hypothetical protein